MRAVLAVRAQLNLVFRIPSRVVTDNGNKGQVVTRSRVEFRHVKAERAVAHHGDDRRARFEDPGSERERNGRADRTGDAIDDALRGIEKSLGPLPDFAAVAD